MPSLELMEAAGPGGRRGGARGRGRRPGRGSSAARATTAATGWSPRATCASRASRSRCCCSWPADELSGDARANLERLRGRRARARRRRARRRARGLGRGRRRDLRHRLRRRPRATPADARSRRSTPVGAPVVAADIASGVDASTGEVEGAAVEADVTVSFHAAKLGHWIAPGKRHAGELGWRRSGSRRAPPASRRRADRARACSPCAPRRGPDSTKFSSGQVLVVGGSRGLTGAVCMAAEAAIRAGAGYATVAVPADLEPIFEVKLTEVMSIGCAERRRAARARRPPSGSSRPPSAPRRSCSAPGSAAATATRASWSRELARADRGAAADRRRRPQRARRPPRAARASAARRRCSPRTRASSAACSRPSPTRSTAHRLASAREAAARSGAVVVLKGDDTIVADAGAAGARQRRSRARRSRPRAPATCSAG